MLKVDNVIPLWSRVRLISYQTSDLSRMKACKRGLEWACNHGQHALDMHDRDILPHLIG